MTKLINLIVISLILSCAAFGDDKIPHRCKVDKDCVLFQNLCNEHLSITKVNLPEQSFSEIKNGATVYLLESSIRPKSCLKHYFVPKSWPEYSVAKCVAQRCEVRIGNSTK